MGPGTQVHTLAGMCTQIHRSTGQTELLLLAQRWKGLTGKKNLPVTVSMEPTLQEAQASSPHMLPAVIWGNNVRYLLAHPPLQPPEQSHGPHRKKKHKSKGHFFPTSLPLGHH